MIVSICGIRNGASDLWSRGYDASGPVAVPGRDCPRMPPRLGVCAKTMSLDTEHGFEHVFHRPIRVPRPAKMLGLRVGHAPVSLDLDRSKTAVHEIRCANPIRRNRIFSNL